MTIDPLEYLLDEYPTAKATDIQLAKLTRRFAPYSNAILLEAIDLYAGENKWFPKWAELRPYIDMAEQKRQMEFYAVPDDGELYALELAAGTMPHIDEIERDIATAARLVPALKKNMVR
jgi:hypothetical protein